jgi:hypothetical protein
MNTIPTPPEAFQRVPCHYCGRVVTGRDPLPLTCLPWTRQLFAGPDHAKECRFWKPELQIDPIQERMREQL